MSLPTIDSELVFDKKEKYYTWLAKERGKGYRPIPIFAGSFTDGTRYTVLDQSKSPVFCLVQDLGSDLPARPEVKTLLSGIATTSENLLEVRLVGLGGSGTVLASIPVSGTVSLAGGSQVRITQAGNTGPTGGQFTTNGLGTAVGLNTFTGPSLPAFASSFVLENLDAVNTVWVGPSTVTNGGANIGFPITKGLTPPPMLLCQPTALYIVDSGVAVTMAWWAM